MKRLLAVMTGALLVAGVATAFGAMSTNTIDSTGTVAKKGRQVQVTVVLGCDRVQNVRVRVTVTQVGGAVAQKSRKVRCTTAPAISRSGRRRGADTASRQGRRPLVHWRSRGTTQGSGART
jgi:hypothetical protein